MNCTACGNTGFVQVERGPAGATYTVLARCKCQTDTVTIPRADYEAMQSKRDALVDGLKAALGHLMNARIDLMAGRTKRTAVTTIDRGIARIQADLRAAGVEVIHGQCSGLANACEQDEGA